METRVSIGDLGSNAVVATVGFYSRLVEQARREAEGYLMATRSSHRQVEGLRIEVARLQLQLEASKLNEKQTRRNCHLRLSYYLEALPPVLESLEAFLNAETPHEQTTHLGVLRTLHRDYLVARTNRAVEPEPTPAHPDPLRAAQDGSPERDA